MVCVNYFTHASELFYKVQYIEILYIAELF